jgi:hypothetical protein
LIFTGWLPPPSRGRNAPIASAPRPTQPGAAWRPAVR